MRLEGGGNEGPTHGMWPAASGPRAVPATSGPPHLVLAPCPDFPAAFLIEIPGPTQTQMAPMPSPAALLTSSPLAQIPEMVPDSNFAVLWGHRDHGRHAGARLRNQEQPVLRDLVAQGPHQDRCAGCAGCGAAGLTTPAAAMIDTATCDGRAAGPIQHIAMRTRSAASVMLSAEYIKGAKDICGC